MTTDDELMDQLRRIANEVDAAPDVVTESARAAFSTRRLDDELAELLQDSHATTAASVRLAQPAPRLLSFESGDVSLELQVEEVRGRIVLRGMAIGTVGDAEIETTTAGRQVIAVDDRGWFRVEALPVEALRVQVQATNGASVTTGWIRP
jgi:hypothetical protein